MDQDIFKAGVRPGSPASRDEIKMLVCYILAKMDTGIRFSELHKALSESSLVNYFDLIQVMEELTSSGHITASNDGETVYTAAKAGLIIAEEFEHMLPISVREKAMRATTRELRRRKRLEAVTIHTTRVDGGYQMELSLPDQNDVLVSFSLFLSTREECELVRRRFLNDPVYIYQNVIALLTGNRDLLGNSAPDADPLF